MAITSSIEVSSTYADGRPNYRFYKLVYTAALRLKLAIPLIGSLNIKLDGKDMGAEKYKSRTKYTGSISINGSSFSEIIFVVDALPKGDELVTFWKKSQPGDAPGAKGGAHQFAEAYLGYLSGKMLESQVFSPEVIVKELADDYNADPKFNITVWIIQKAQSLKTEPSIYNEPVEPPTLSLLPEEFIPELLLRNKWKTDVLRTGVFYTNYEVDACIKDLGWGRDDRIQCQLHWEDGKFILIEDFGRYDRYTEKTGRMRVYEYMKKYSDTSSRIRLILTLKGDSTQWTLASSTMLKRLNKEIQHTT
jgi:hypothetical protein